MSWRRRLALLRASEVILGAIVGGVTHFCGDRVLRLARRLVVSA
jgi:hypothetical protein